jgi:hypothetical protein
MQCLLMIKQDNDKSVSTFSEKFLAHPHYTEKSSSAVKI